MPKCEKCGAEMVDEGVAGVDVAVLRVGHWDDLHRFRLLCPLCYALHLAPYRCWRGVRPFGSADPSNVVPPCGALVGIAVLRHVHHAVCSIQHVSGSRCGSNLPVDLEIMSKTQPSLSNTYKRVSRRFRRGSRPHLPAHTRPVLGPQGVFHEGQQIFTIGFFFCILVADTGGYCPLPR